MRGLVAAIFMAACHPQPPPTHMDMFLPQPAPGSCARTVVATTANVCANMFTHTGLACVRCENAQGCVDVEAAIYCVRGTCLDDKTCTLQLPDVGGPR